MKKLIASLTLVSLAVMTLSPALAFAVDPTVGTGLTRGAGGGSAPIVKVKWEMWDLGKDDSTNAGAQFLAPGVWNETMKYKVCAIATDPNGVADIDGVYADIYYPATIAYKEDPAHPDSHPCSPMPGVGIGACGAFIEENTLLPLSKADGYDLFCNKIRNNNNNLPTFNSGYNYDEICAADGELMKETAYVYCDPKTLKWEDPAGMYKVVVTAQDKAGNNSASGSLTNHFEYLPLTAFAKDFNSVSYGQVMLNSHQIVSGDLVFGSGDATIRNTGNTRLNMKVAQDDMGLGQSSGQWNVGFDGRVGNHANDWSKYWPFDYKGTGSPTAGEYTKLEDILELSETEEMDFSVLVTKWPDANTSYGGTMWLDAVFAPFRICAR